MTWNLTNLGQNKREQQQITRPHLLLSPVETKDRARHMSIQLENIHNFRDLGGKITADGKRITKSNLLYRCATTSNASSKDVETLQQLPITTILDLRGSRSSSKENSYDVVNEKNEYNLNIGFPPTPVDVHVDDLSGTADQVNLNQAKHSPSRQLLAFINSAVKSELKKQLGNVEMLATMTIMWTLNAVGYGKYLFAWAPQVRRIWSAVVGWLKVKFMSFMAIRHGGFGNMYYIIATVNQKSIKRGLDLCVDQRRQPVLFHCTSGKDRTGITAALLLHAAGCDRETIIDDYCQSHKWGTSDIHVHQIMGFDAEEAPNFDYSTVLSTDGMSIIVGAPRISIITFLDSLEQKYGSLNLYLDSIGCDNVWRTNFRNSFTVPT